MNESAEVPTLPSVPLGRGEASAPVRVCGAWRCRPEPQLPGPGAPSGRRGSGPAPRGGFGEVPAARGSGRSVGRQQVKGTVDGGAAGKEAGGENLP